ncbi:hypothetical protein GOBAR_DD14148 [Gossypium barbadense]|nr:hypothetical protein GOBAR_DD14148 [Gossypium barbadense]
MKPADCKVAPIPMSQQRSTTPSSFRVNSKPKDQSAARPKSVPPDTTKNSRKSVMMMNKPKSGDQLPAGGCYHKGRVVEQFGKPRRSSANSSSTTEKNSAVDELREKLSCSEGLVKDLQTQVMGLRAELDGARSLNMELESLNRKLKEDLAAAEDKIAALSRSQVESTRAPNSRTFRNSLPTNWNTQKLRGGRQEQSPVSSYRFVTHIADERAVLKHFKWPERKADAMREAAIEYRDLKLLEMEISSFEDDTSNPCGVALKRMAGLLDKSERSIQRLIKLRNSVIRSYQECKIPVDWMLDSGMVYKIKQASMKLVTMYIKRVGTELQLVRSLDKESAQEALLLQGMHFANRAHQFAGDLDSETLCAFEEIKECIPGHLVGSKELLAGISSA